MDSSKIYKYVEFGILIIGIVLFVKYSGISFKKETVVAFEWEKEVNVYFIDLKKAETASCEADVALKRKVPNAETLGPSAIQMLIDGLTQTKSGSIYSAINSRTLLQKFELINGTAYVDFNSELVEGAGGSCRVIAIRSQIEKTLLDLPDINKVVISINGQTEGILEP